MESKLVINFAILLIPAWFGLLSAGLPGLQEEDVNLIVPTAAEQGADISMYCNFDSKRWSFDSIKWYKGRREFFRYSPKERPEKKVLPMDTLTVDENQSSMHKVFLRNIPLGLTGNISCEVTTDPDYRSIQKYQYLTVIAHAAQPPVLTVLPTYSDLRTGEMLTLKCRSGTSKPAANLTFTINNNTYMSSTFKQDRPIRLNETADMTGEAEAKVTLTENHFVDNKIRIQCIAEIMGIKRYSNVYEKEQQVQSKAVTSHNFGLKSNNSDGLQPGIRVVILAFFLSFLLSPTYLCYQHHHHHHRPHPLLRTFLPQ